jgi:hypothetical protein
MFSKELDILGYMLAVGTNIPVPLALFWRPVDDRNVLVE